MKLEQVYKETVGMMPIYTETGNATRVLYLKEEGKIDSVIFPQQLERIKLKWAGLYAVDLKAQARQLQSKYQRSAPLPFYAPKGKVFVPFKLRLTKVTGDAIYGYICTDVISQIKMLSRSDCLLFLSDGSELPIYSSVETAKLAYYLGKEIVRDCFYEGSDKNQELLTALQTLRKYFLPSGNV